MPIVTFGNRIKEDKEQKQNYNSQKSKFGVFRRDIKHVRLCNAKAGGAVFKVLPAIDINTVREEKGQITADMTSIMPTRDENGIPNTWALTVYYYPSVGHGAVIKSTTRKDIISMRTFDRELPDPMKDLIEAAMQYKEWQYLFEEGPNKQRAPLWKRPAEILAMNVILANNATQEVVLGSFTPGLTNSFLGDAGVLYRINPTGQGAQRWYLGDFTDINTGWLLRTFKDSQGNWNVDLFIDQQTRQPVQYPVPANLLPKRYNLYDPASVVYKPTYEEVVEDIVSVLNSWDPSGTLHEYELLKFVFGTKCRIPDPPPKFGQSQVVNNYSQNIPATGQQPNNQPIFNNAQVNTGQQNAQYSQQSPAVNNQQQAPAVNNQQQSQAAGNNLPEHDDIPFNNQPQVKTNFGRTFGNDQNQNEPVVSIPKPPKTQNNISGKLKAGIPGFNTQVQQQDHARINQPNDSGANDNVNEIANKFLNTL